MTVDVKEIQIPVIIKRDNKSCDVYIPDLDMTIHGDDFVSAIANASMKASAVYFWFTTYIALTS